MQTREAFAFDGDGGEYFRIWIVNLVLTILTLGIYSAWAKVRKNRYFYGNTRLAESTFEYLADPVKILKGRLIVFAVLGLSSLISNFVPLFSPASSLLIFLGLPWLVVRSRVFNAVNSAYRNIRFGFDGAYGQAVEVFIGVILLIPLTLGLAYPYFVYQRYEFLLANQRYGTARMQFHVGAQPFFATYLLGGVGFLAVSLVLVLLFITLSAALSGAASQVPRFAAVAMTPVALMGYLAAITFVRVRNLNTVWNSVTLAEHRFESSLTFGGMYRLSLVNTVAVILSAGLFLPWARVRMAQYRAEHTALLVQGDLGEFLALEGDRVAALDDEVADALDFDFGL